MLIRDWKRVLRKAWSVRLVVIAALMSGVEIALPFFSDVIPRGLFAGLSFLSVAGAFMARFYAQKEFKDGQ
jgi:hypothetical protein